MIYSVKGELTHTEPNLAVVECAGVGYACRTTFTTLSQIGQIGETVKLLTHLHVREDAVEKFCEVIRNGFFEKFGHEPSFYVTETGDGAKEIV